jgi:N-acetylglucosaminyldiphosphoundecaprenol N-acetyl-beta-D-mannosaminyltransferase
MTATILGIRVDGITQDLAVQAICQAAQSKQKLKVATINPEFIMAAQANSDFKRVLDQAGLALPDGIGVMWAANLNAQVINKNSRIIKILNIWIVAIYYGFKTFMSLKFRTANIPQQVSGSNLIHQLAKQAASQNLTLFLLGERPGIAERAAAALKKIYPHLIISGTFAGNGSAKGDTETRRMITQHPADIILVAYGAPKQELWISRNLSHVSASVAIGVGGTFRFLAGDIKRAPVWVQRIGFEWLFRLIQEPWRWRRQLALPKFIWTVVQAKINKSN